MNDASDPKIMWRVRRTLEKMLTKRGYQCPAARNDRMFAELTYEEFTQNYGSERIDKTTMNFVAKRSEDEEDRIWIFFSAIPKVGVDQVRHFVQTMNRVTQQQPKGEGGAAAQPVSSRPKKAIVVADQAVSPFGRTAMANLAPRFLFEDFTTAQLLVDITEHELVPEHVKLSAEEKKQLLIRYNLNETQLPRMVLADPIARYFGLVRGDVVKITRPSETAGRYVTYRIVL